MGLFVAPESAQGSQVPAEEKEIFGSISSNKANEDLNPRITLNPRGFATKNIDGEEGSPWFPACQRRTFLEHLPSFDASLPLAAAPIKSLG